jgi:hypothetical protein
LGHGMRSTGGLAALPFFALSRGGPTEAIGSFRPTFDVARHGTATYLTIQLQTWEPTRLTLKTVRAQGPQLKALRSSSVPRAAVVVETRTVKLRVRHLDFSAAIRLLSTFTIFSVGVSLLGSRREWQNGVAAPQRVYGTLGDKSKQSAHELDRDGNSADQD